MNQPRLVGGRYRLLTPIGRGGMGVVWQAHDTAIGREVAIKQVHIPPDLSPDDHARLRARTLHEARAAAHVRHPSVVAIHDVVEDGAEPWIVMELVKGRSLDQIVRSGGPMSPEWAASIGLFVLSALASAHSRGLQHRDVKPANVLLADDGRVMLSDFGIATRAGGQPGGAPMGTPGFTAPEALTEEPGRAAGPASDLWSLGATIYTAVEGVPPFSRPTALATHGAVMTEPPRPPQRSGPLAPLLMRLLEKDPARRPDTVTLRAALNSITQGTAATVPASRSTSWVLPRLPVYGFAAAVIVAFVMSVTLILATSSPSAPLSTSPPAAAAGAESPPATATPTGAATGTASPSSTGTPIVRTPGKFTTIPRPCQLLTRDQATQVVGTYRTTALEPTVVCAWSRVRDDKALTMYLTLYLYPQQGDGYETRLAEDHVQGAKAKAESEAGRGGTGTKLGEVFDIPGAGDGAVAWEVQDTTFSTKKHTVYSVFRTSNIVGQIRFTRNVTQEPGLRDKAAQAVKYLAENLDAKA
ncbi:serine/threonine-protein kinase [Nonomuraea angiospora]|uniref:serine/threonine-protein kinase n=1 Tax=Nonomuraea angiospora TaxID=46172 RepID=UPI0029A8079C|nr:protein kinase [Nonomuraea angiospora]MDX3102036.1 protein kinase [Nonomuraea angiospora]